MRRHDWSGDRVQYCGNPGYAVQCPHCLAWKAVEGPDAGRFQGPRAKNRDLPSGYGWSKGAGKCAEKPTHVLVVKSADLPPDAIERLKRAVAESMASPVVLSVSSPDKGDLSRMEVSGVVSLPDHRVARMLVADPAVNHGSPLVGLTDAHMLPAREVLRRVGFKLGDRVVVMSDEDYESLRDRGTV